MAHTVIPPPRGTTATLELTHKGNINDKTIPERDREVRDFNVTLLFNFKSVYYGVTSARGVRNIKIERHPVRISKHTEDILMFFGGLDDVTKQKQNIIQSKSSHKTCL